MSTTYPLPREKRRATVMATAGQTVFGPFTILAFAAEDIAVYQRLPGDPRFTRLTTGYTVSPAAPAVAFPAHFMVTFSTGRVADAEIRVDGRRTHERTTDVTLGGSIRSTLLENELDRQTIVFQELRRDVDDFDAEFDAIDAAVNQVEGAADRAEAAFDAFDARYLGAKAADPATDNDGNPLVIGAEYFNTTVGQRRVWTGSGWAAQPAPPDKSVTNAKLADVPAATLKGSVAGGAPADLTAPQVRGILGGEFYNAVADGGCDATGAANTRAAINAAITAAVAAKKPIWFPQGDYTLTGGPIQVPSDAWIICHPKAKFTRTDNTLAATVEIVGKSNIVIDGMWIHYTPTTSQLGYAQVGFQVRNGSKQVTLRNCRSTGRINRAFHILNSRDVTVADCYVLGASNAALRVVSDQASTSAVTLGESTNVQCTNIIIRGCTFDGAETDGSTTQFTSYGINFAGETGVNDQVARCRVIDCLMRNMKLQGLEMGGKVFDCHATNCHAHLCGNATDGGFGFLFQLYGGTGAFGCTMEQCTATFGGYGFAAYSANYCQFIHCNARSCAFDGFFAQDCNSGVWNACTALSCSGDGFDLRNVDYCSFAMCNASVNAGWGFIADVNSDSNSLFACTALTNTLGKYSTTWTNAAGTNNR